MSRADDDKEFRVPYPVELVIRQTPLSSQASNSKAKEDWKRTVGQHARDSIGAVREQYWLDERPVMATIYYFPPARMGADVDNIVKLILDGMKGIAYPDDHCIEPDDNCIERVVVQKFEPGIAWLFPSPSPALEEAIKSDKPTLYIRVEDDLAWRDAS